MPFVKNNPKPPNSGKKKGSLNKKTLLAKAAGVQGWDDLRGWIEGPGIQKYVEELNKLKGVQFNQELRNMAEFFRPKLSRQEHTGQIQSVNYNVDLTKKEIKEITESFENDY